MMKFVSPGYRRLARSPSRSLLSEKWRDFLWENAQNLRRAEACGQAGPEDGASWFDIKTEGLSSACLAVADWQFFGKN